MKRLFHLMTGATLLALPCALGLACSTTNGAGSETHFVCSRDADCVDEGSHCVAGKCARDPSAGGRGTGGAAGGQSAGGQSAGGLSVGGPSTGGAGSGGRASDGGSVCGRIEPRSPCNDGGLDCITDLRTASSRFSTCSTGPFGIPTLVRCGRYDAVVMSGIDSATSYYFDHTDGHFVAFGNSGLGDNTCQTLDPAFQIPVCTPPPSCPMPDGGHTPPSCVDAPLDAGTPLFCPAVAQPRPEPGRLPTPQEDGASVTLKFVEGSHVRLTDGTLGIDPQGMLDEDPGLLKCSRLTVEAAQCCVAAIDAALSPELGISVARAFTRPEADLDAERASGRKMSGEYLNDLNLYYVVQTKPDRLPAVYDVLATSRCVDTVYYTPIGVPP